jgi:hypothetical protein
VEFKYSKKNFITMNLLIINHEFSCIAVAAGFSYYFFRYKVKKKGEKKIENIQEAKADPKPLVAEKDDLIHENTV